ncbi:SDR family NAD(P)-dependent oxidoreductase [Acidaminococcus fermentans]|uniref:SDR family NAD(P)-dependent oxidoreductase n=1 Tax=Acidaminococcus fermentans TaxID=905 RepID=UPI002E77020C|nr:SDR family NAD(P)-dependent oxidoreductase [Acidaminococcus fermentans]MEE1598210.1 SDR family NAD(P)-dependent oxidoreductase [Acidaminococcus fermentans]MEE4122472.1 SDR family NAD(P)-dependent oxidoreductase [Acidaminococcus fermentans]
MEEKAKKAIVIGGSNGIGLAISHQLIDNGYFVEICDRVEPDFSILESNKYHYNYLDLLELDENLLYKLASDKKNEVLMITAGVGRIADFQYHHTAEIDKILSIDTISTLKIFRIFYNRILNDSSFYTGVMGSISGWMISPCASIYAAAKAAVVRFVESVNIELEVYGSKNRILDISPASFKGSKFYGGKNDLSVMIPLANEIIQNLFNRKTKYIPDYQKTFKAILQWYHENPHAYGLYSYRYKKDSGRVDNQKRVKIGYLSGTFDLFHIGHLNLLRRAKKECDYLIVGVHASGKWKGKETFIPLEERKAIVAACKYVDKVVDSCTEDSDAWKLWHYDKLFVGSDYKGSDRFNRYEAYFKDKGVEIVYFPYTKSTSSTQLREIITQQINK